MPRPPRLHVPGGCYHVTLRGNHREALFATAADRVRLNEFVADAIDRFGARLHAFCWMTNHLHALMQIGEQPLGGLVKSIATRYSRYRHKTLDTTGHLFERRYGAQLIQVERYFLAVLRYIHLNPVKARMVSDPAGYRWSSHRVYLGTESIDWVTTDLGLSLLGINRRHSRTEYGRLIESGQAEDDEDLVDEASVDDQRILGGTEFAASLDSRASQPREAEDLANLAVRVCAKYGISLELLRSRVSQRRLTPIRLELLERALSTGIANLADVARFIGRDPSTLCKQRKKFQRIQ